MAVVSGINDTNSDLSPGIPGMYETVVSETPDHLRYLNEFRTRQCTDFLQHKCTLHRPYLCFNWHFANQKRRKPVITPSGNFNYSADTYCTNYDETSGICQNGDECPLLHRTAGDTERRFHLRYYKTCPCVHETDNKGNCMKNAQHCPYAHGPTDLRRPVVDRSEQTEEETEARGIPSPQCPLNSVLETDRLLNEDPVWTDPNYVLANYKTQQCMRPLRLCRQGFACPSYHNPRDKRRSPAKFKYRSTPCPNVKVGEEWGDPLKCDLGDQCGYCHTRTEQQFHLEIYKSSKCNDMVSTGYCPRGLYCAFAHTEAEMNLKWDVSMVPGAVPLGAFVTTLPQARRTEGATDSNGLTTAINTAAAAELALTLTQQSVLGNSNLANNAIPNHAAALLASNVGGTDPWFPDPIGKGRAGMRQGAPVQLSGSLNEKFLTQQVLQRGLSLEVDSPAQQNVPDIEGYQRPSTMSVGSYMQYREAIERQIKAQAELYASGSRQSLSASGNRLPHQPYRVERAALEGYLANNAAPPQSSLTLPSTFFTDNETIESVVGTGNEDDIDVNLGDLNSVLDREMSHDADVNTLSDSINSGLNLQSTAGGPSGPMMIPMARTQQRHNSIGSVQSILEAQLRHHPAQLASSVGAVGSGLSAFFNSPARQQQLQQLRSQQEAANAFLDQQSQAAAAAGDFARQNYIMGLLSGGGDVGAGGGGVMGGGGGMDLGREDLFQPSRLGSVWEEDAEAKLQAEILAAAQIGRFYNPEEGGTHPTTLLGPNGLPHNKHVTFERAVPMQRFVAPPGGYGALDQQQALRPNLPAALCSMCNIEPYSVISQPCAHLVLCGQCAYKIGECPVCRCPVSQWASTPHHLAGSGPSGGLGGQMPRM